MNQAYSLAAGFIVSCPDTNPELPLTPFPGLNVTSQGVQSDSGTPVTLMFNSSVATSSSNETTSFFLALLSGLDTVFVPISGSPDNGTATAMIPGNLQGTVYALVTDNGDSATDSDTIAGAVVLQLPFDSNANMTA